MLPGAICYFGGETSWESHSRNQTKNAMIQKRLLRPDRRRQVPAGFSWVDHRLVRQDYLSRCDCTALALYLFLVTVGDAEGLSYYSDAAICHRLHLQTEQLREARTHLRQVELVAYQRPLYQVLALEDAPPTIPPSSQRACQTQSVADVLRRALQGGHHD
jgi:hypothetical protein